MKRIIPVVLAMVIGFIGGIIAAEWIGIIGHLLFDHPSWLKYVRSIPFVAPFVCGTAVLLLMQLRGK